MFFRKRGNMGLFFWKKKKEPETEQHEPFYVPKPWIQIGSNIECGAVYEELHSLYFACVSGVHDDMVVFDRILNGKITVENMMMTIEYFCECYNIKKVCAQYDDIEHLLEYPDNTPPGED
jgi:hypothetical protein